MQNRVLLTSIVLFIGLISWSRPAEVQASRTVCGVDVSRSSRCYRELRRLRKACDETPTICGVSYESTSPDFAKAKARCARLRRRNRRRWARGLCGVRLFSPPKTYCGLRGVQVAVACIKRKRKDAPAPVSPAVGQVAPKAPAPATPAAKQAPVSPAPRAAAPALRRAAAPTKKRAALGSARLTTPTRSSGTPFWMILLQLLTFVLVLFLLFRRSGSRGSQKEWYQAPSWDEMPARSWDEPAPAEKGRNQERVLDSIQRMEDRVQRWQEQQEEQWSDFSSPLREMQAQADSLLDYYTKVAQQVVQSSASGSEDESGYQKRLIDARGRLRWMFQAHRELPTQDSPVESLKAASWHRLQHLLEAFGHLGWEAELETHMANGQFSAADFIERKSEDQAMRFCAGEELQTFAALREEFLSCLETLYRANLKGIREACSAARPPLSDEQKEELFVEDYILDFLLDELPSLLQELTRRSHPTSSGALVDQFVCFIEEQLEEAGVELFPVLDDELTETIGARLLYLLHAGVRWQSGQTVLRSPDSSVMSVEEETGEPSSVQVVTKDIISEHSLTPESAPSLSGFADVQVALDNGVRASWFDAPAKEGVFHVRNVPEPPFNDAPSISHPDSDPPEHTAEMTSASHPPAEGVGAEPLPTGPLPHIENITQHSVKAAVMPEPESQRQMTSEYGLFATESHSPEGNG